MLKNFFLILLLALLSACASTPEPPANTAELQAIVDYRLELAPNHPDSIDQIYSIDVESAQQILEPFSRYPKLRAIGKLADWLVEPTGYGLVYDVDANLKPQEVLEQMRQQGIVMPVHTKLMKSRRPMDVIHKDRRLRRRLSDNGG